MATAAQNRQARQQAAQRGRIDPVEAEDAQTGLDRLGALGIEAAQRGARPQAVPGLDIGKLLPGPLAGIFGATANPDAPRNKRAAADALAGAQAANEAAGLAFEGELAASGIDSTELSPERLEGLSTLHRVNPAAAERAFDEIQAGQQIDITPAEVRQAQRDAVDLTRANVDLRIARQTADQADIATNMAALKFQQASGQGMSPERLVQTSDMLFDDRRRDIAPFQDQLSSFDQLMAIIDTETGPASMATIFKFIKSMDDSVVRDSEGRMLGASSGLLRQMQNEFNKLQGGGQFDEQTRQEIKQAATQLAEASFASASAINADHDKRLANFSREFQSPALQRLGAAGTGFDRDRVFETVTVDSLREAEAAGRIPFGEIPEGFEEP